MKTLAAHSRAPLLSLPIPRHMVSFRVNILDQAADIAPHARASNMADACRQASIFGSGKREAPAVASLQRQKDEALRKAYETSQRLVSVSLSLTILARAADELDGHDAPYIPFSPDSPSGIDIFRHSPDEEPLETHVSRLTWLLLDFLRLSEADAGPAAFEARKAAVQQALFRVYKTVSASFASRDADLTRLGHSELAQALYPSTAHSRRCSWTTRQPAPPLRGTSSPATPASSS